MYKVTAQVKELRGNCALGYKPGDTFTIEKFYIKDTGKGICLHALASMLTLLAPLLKGVPATALGIGKKMTQATPSAQTQENPTPAEEQ